MYLVLDEAKDESNRISTKQVKRKLDIEVDEKNGNVTASINLKLKIGVDSYPHNLNKNINQNELSQKISRELTKQAKEITNILQEANCDPFGIGLRVSTTYPETWEKLNWDKDFKNVTIKPNVEVEIIKTGSIY
ncbi:hypothetical protein NKR20_09115 [Lysinibacillus endophyticus]|nr:Ger(x)C family spore germination C-terminal domain-containing protein [Lysinibacillus endophyticus]MCP1144887.1 hypothetical protein [Lysinibacillus endophyticus]